MEHTYHKDINNFKLYDACPVDKRNTLDWPGGVLAVLADALRVDPTAFAPPRSTWRRQPALRAAPPPPWATMSPPSLTLIYRLRRMKHEMGNDVAVD